MLFLGEPELQTTGYQHERKTRKYEGDLKMTLHVMLSLDLSNVSDKRYNFNTVWAKRTTARS